MTFETNGRYDFFPSIANTPRYVTSKNTKKPVKVKANSIGVLFKNISKFVKEVFKNAISSGMLNIMFKRKEYIPDKQASMVATKTD